MRNIFLVCLVSLVLGVCSFANEVEKAEVSKELRGKRAEVMECLKPVMEKMRARREEQRKGNVEFFKSEVEKLDLTAEEKEKVIALFEERGKKVRDRMMNMRKNRNQKGKNKEE
jgi:hypothetical protein